MKVNKGGGRVVRGELHRQYIEMRRTSYGRGGWGEYFAMLLEYQRMNERKEKNDTCVTCTDPRFFSSFFRFALD